MVIASLSLLVLLIWMTVFHQHRYSFSRTFIGGLILTGPLILSVLTDSFLSHEVWAGTLISLSLAAYGRGWTAISVISGLSALLLRELAIPFICVMLVMAFMEGRRRQALLWLGCIVLFGCVFLIHWSAVKHAWMPGDLAIKKGWVRFGGWEFVLKTAQTNTFLLLAPPWVAAILLPLSLLGLAGWRDQPGARIFLTVYVYVIAFSILGKAFNVYWGWMYTSIMLLGLLYLPCSLRDLFLSITSVLRKHSSKT
jgi:hypothetical protein